MLDREALLEPISADAPAGSNLQEQAADLTFQEVNESRADVPPEDDPSGQGHEPNWSATRRLCEEALQEKTKDLDLAGFLTEAMVHLDGFEGLRDGLSLVRGLLETFWDHLHPGKDEDGEIVLPIRARPLTWLGSSHEFLRTVRAATIVSCADGRHLDWEAYKNTDMVDERKSQSGEEAYQNLIDAGFMGGEEWSTRLSNASTDELRHTLKLVRDSEEELRELRVLGSKLLEDDEPNFVPLGELIMDVREYLEAHVPEEVEAEALAEGEAGAAGRAAGPAASTGPIKSRADALRRLSEVADYFHQSEPHSPIAYLVKRTVRWGNMPLEDLLEEIVQDDSVLARIWETLGIKRGGQSESE